MVFLSAVALSRSFLSMVSFSLGSVLTSKDLELGTTGELEHVVLVFQSLSYLIQYELI